jgi:hypothetical protein
MASGMSDDLHERFIGWLLAGGEGDPPRDAAIHASVCAECERWIAAHDALMGVHPGRAPMPPSRGVPEARGSGWRTAGRLAAASGSLLVIGGVAAVGVPELMHDLGKGPDQGVLAATGTPDPTPWPSSDVSAELSTTASATATVTASATPPSASPGPSFLAILPTPRPATPRPTPTRAVSTPTAKPVTPTPTPTASASPSPTPTPSPTPDPSASAS